MQAFETWNAWSQEAIKRWKRTETRGMLSISTTGCYGCEGVISPRAIRKGRGDRYLLTVNRKLAQWGRPTYIRLLPEMNGHWNPYSAFDADGSRRGSVPQDGAVPQGLEADGRSSSAAARGARSTTS